MTTSSTFPSTVDLMKEAGSLLLQSEADAALRAYVKLFSESPDLAATLGFNFSVARRRHRQKRVAAKTCVQMILASAPSEDAADMAQRIGAQARIVRILPASVAAAAQASAAQTVPLQETRDIRPQLAAFVLANPCDVLHVMDADCITLVCALYTVLVWDSRIVLHGAALDQGIGGAAPEPDPVLPRKGDGRLDCSLHHRSVLDRLFAPGMAALVAAAAAAPAALDRVLSPEAEKIFALLDGWAGLKSEPEASRPDAPAAAGGPARSAAPPAAAPLAPGLIREARKDIISVEKQVLGFLRRMPQQGQSAEDFRSWQTAGRELDLNVTSAIRAIKDTLARAHDRTTAAAPSDLAATRQDILSDLADLQRFLPTTPYYDRLSRMVEGCNDPDALRHVINTVRQIDLARLGQVPLLAGPLVSVIMPSFNRERLIGDAIRSVLAQSYSTIELLICDDASTDGTVNIIKSFKDKRIRLITQTENRGAAAARNLCLGAARGTVIAYLDSDNIWHPRYLEMALEQLADWPGQLAAYAGFFDIHVNRTGQVKLRGADLRNFHLEDQIDKPFIDLNSFIHSRRLYDTLGGFDERLARRQDYDLVSRYCWAREPQKIPYLLNLYQRFETEEQITRTQRHNQDAPALIRSKIETYYQEGLPASLPPWLKKVSVLSWDMSRNHFAKAYCVAEALSRHVEVELISYRFFDEEVFQPLADMKPAFETKYFEGGNFPDFFDNFARGVDAVTGDAIYAVKPRLTSFGLGLMANYHTGKPLMLECNDLETVVNTAKAKDTHASHSLDAVFDAMDKAVVPHELIWSQVLDPLVTEIPVTFTHNINLNIHYQKRCLYMRNIKDDSLYDPARYDRDATRRSLGFGPEDRVILFGGLVRKHKGIFELVELLTKLADPRYKLLVVGSRETPDLRKLSQHHRDSVFILPPQPPEKMAEINLASDLVVLWFDPLTAAGHYQSPYKMSDALAMGPSIIGSPTSDLANFAQRELVWNVPFGDDDGLVAKIREIFAHPEERLRRQKRARRFFEREFSYKSVHPAFALGASGVERDRIYPAAEKFAAFFAEFERRARKAS